MNAGALVATALILRAVAQEPVRVEVQHSVTVPVAGATAVFAVDPSVAEVLLDAQTVVVRGVRPGTTTVTTVGADLGHFRVQVVPAPRPGATPAWGARAGGSGTFDLAFDSALGQLRAGLTASGAADGRTYQGSIALVGSLPGVAAAATRQGPLALAAASMTVRDAHGRLTLLDEYVQVSPLSVSGVTLRGAHLDWRGLRLHAGFTSFVRYRDLLLLTDAVYAAGGSFRVAVDEAWQLVPTVFWYSQTVGTGAPGLMGSLMLERRRDGDPLRVRAELGLGRDDAGAGAFELGWRGRTTDASLQLLHRPRNFASLRADGTPGTSVDARLRQQLAERLTVGASAQARRQDLGGVAPESASATVDVRHASGRWSVTNGVTASHLRADPSAAPLRSVTWPLSLGYAGEVLGGTATYRPRWTVGSQRLGHGGRIGLYVGPAALRASVHGDLQQDAPTLDVILRDAPELERLLVELGLEAQDTDALRALLVENGALLQQGYLEGLTLRLAPWRFSSGLDVTWRAQDASRAQLRLQALLRHDAGVTRTRQTTLAALTASRHLFGPVEGTVSVSYWQQDPLQGVSQPRWSFAVGVRGRLDSLAALTRPFAPRTIRGTTFQDEDGSGAATPEELPRPGTRLLLDGVREAVTDARGEFRFDEVPDGPHQLTVVLAAGEFITTPLPVARPGDRLRIGVAQAPARLGGVVRGDGGEPLAGVRVLVRGPGGERALVTDGSGAFRFEGEEGLYGVSVDLRSLPHGYDFTRLRTEGVAMAVDRPGAVAFELPAQRTVSGRVEARRSLPTHVLLRELGRSAPVGPDGAFVFRGLPAGRFTLVAWIDGVRAERVVQLPRRPALIRNLPLSARDAAVDVPEDASGLRQATWSK